MGCLNNWELTSDVLELSKESARNMDVHVSTCDNFIGGDMTGNEVWVLTYAGTLKKIGWVADILSKTSR